MPTVAAAPVFVVLIALTAVAALIPCTVPLLAYPMLLNLPIRGPARIFAGKFSRREGQDYTINPVILMLRDEISGSLRSIPRLLPWSCARFEGFDDFACDFFPKFFCLCHDSCLLLLSYF